MCALRAQWPEATAIASRQLTQRYLADHDNTLVLCVVSDEVTSLRNTKIFSEIKSLDYLHDRTIVVLTQVDKSAENPARLQRRLHGGGALEFKPRAIIPVINKRVSGNGADDHSFERATQAEYAHFMAWNGMVRAGLAKAGLNDVLRELVDLTTAHLRVHWLPRQQQEMRRLLDASIKTLKGFGEESDRLSVGGLASALAARIMAVFDFPGEIGKLQGIIREKHTGYPPAPFLDAHNVIGFGMATQRAAHAAMGATEARNLKVSFQWFLSGAEALREPQTARDVIHAALSCTKMPVAAKLLNGSAVFVDVRLDRVDFEPLLKKFMAEVPSPYELAASNAGHCILYDNTRHIYALYDWVVLPLVAFLEGGWKEEFKGAGRTQAPVAFHELGPQAEERILELEKKKRLDDITENLKQWSMQQVRANDEATRTGWVNPPSSTRGTP